MARINDIMILNKIESEIKAIKTDATLAVTIDFETEMNGDFDLYQKLQDALNAITLLKQNEAQKIKCKSI